MENSAVAAFTVTNLLLATLITTLHREGVLPIAKLLEDFHEASVDLAVKNHDESIQNMLSAQLQEMTKLSEMLGEFAPRR